MLISDAGCTELFNSEGAIHTGAVDKSVERNNDMSFFPWTYPWLLAYPHNPWPNNKDWS